MNTGIKTLTGALLLIAMSVAPGAQAAVGLYATGGGQFELSGLWTVNPLNGDAALVWNLPGIAIYAGGLAYDPGTDMLYATGATVVDSGTSRLFRINRFTGVTTADFDLLRVRLGTPPGPSGLHPNCPPTCP